MSVEIRDAEPTFRVEKYRFMKKRVGLDLSAIDEELSEVPMLIQEAGECVGLAMEIRESLKDELEIVKSQLGSALRIVDSKGKEKSEARIASEIPDEPDYKAKRDELSVARLDAALWMTLLESLRAKHSCIGTAADLIKAGYLTQNFIMEKRRSELRQGRVPITK